MQTKTATPLTDWRAVRDTLGYGLREVAREAHIDPAHLSRIERGLATPSIEVVQRLARVLGLRQVVIYPKGDHDAA